MTWLVSLPVIIPLVSAGLALALSKRTRAQGIISMIALTAVLAVSVALIFVTHTQGPQVVNVGGWAAPVGIALVADRLSALMLVVSAVVLLAVLAYSLAQGLADGNEGAPVAIYHPTYLVLAAGVATAFLSGDLFNLYVGFEVLLAASFVLLTLGGTGERIRAGSIYVIVSLLSSILFLISIALIYAATGTLNFAQLSERIVDIDAGLRIVLQIMLLMGFAIKAAIFPLSAWLPDSYPTAPAPVTAVFAGLLTKVGVYAIIRAQTLLFTDGSLDTVLMVLAVLTMLVGIAGAVAQEDIKRLLSFTLVSHIGYMIFGISLASDVGLSAAIFYVAHHITVQTALFLVAGLIERRGGSTSLERLGSLAKLAPVLGVLFFVSAMNLAGIPPMSGFLGKLGLLLAGLADGSGLAVAGVVAGLATSLLTLYAVVKAWNKAFWQRAPEELPTATVPRTMIGPAAALVALGVLIAFVGGPLYAYTDAASRDLRARTPYVDAVIVDGERGEGESSQSEDSGAAEDATNPAEEPSGTETADPRPTESDEPSGGER
ncbi:Na+/H+ antiporter subunit D [Ruania alba]|uniref:Multisubunit sodium/proton antiporter, MrpD subunit n=1 Tax=Ruania alba TaxID=648782 RepID=A0A1H5KQB9_9MICO|nr:Na+/H+ antiporter subunit D [Ruania alba]SEE66963.1 multisubunit sodium/proton antiporter, MrpD subunit [Ruania alba]